MITLTLIAKAFVKTMLLCLNCIGLFLIIATLYTVILLMVITVSPKKHKRLTKKVNHFILNGWHK